MKRIRGIGAEALRTMGAHGIGGDLLFVAAGSFFAVFGVLAVRYLLHTQGLGGVFSAAPFWNPHTFNLRAFATTTSFAALTYIGFDSVTTLAEDVRNPRRNVLLAVVLVVVAVAVGAGVAAIVVGRPAAGQAATADIKLKPTPPRNLPGQLTNAEWMLSMPGSDEQKAFLLGCNGCHTIERIVPFDVLTGEMGEEMEDQLLVRLAGGIDPHVRERARREQTTQ